MQVVFSGLVDVVFSGLVDQAKCDQYTTGRGLRHWLARWCCVAHPLGCARLSAHYRGHTQGTSRPLGGSWAKLAPARQTGHTGRWYAS